MKKICKLVVLWSLFSGCIMHHLTVDNDAYYRSQSYHAKNSYYEDDCCLRNLIEVLDDINRELERTKNKRKRSELLSKIKQQNALINAEKKELEKKKHAFELNKKREEERQERQRRLDQIALQNEYNRKREEDRRRINWFQRDLSRMERENAVRQQSNQYRMQKEERDTALAIENSKKTFAEEEARRRKEESDLALAIENSKKTFAEEEARRAAPSSHVVVPHVSEVSLTPATAPAAEWEPNSGDMYNAGKYIMDYKNELHRNPTSNEIKQRLQSKMPHLSSVQIDKIMDDMGV